jgi:glycosyltransferase involved in cell wall biosynthesis
MGHRPKKKILFVMAGLNLGGAHVVTLTLLKNLSREKFDLSLAVVVSEGPHKSLIPSDIPVTFLNCSRVRESFIPLIKLIRREKPETIMVTIGYMAFVILMARPFLPSPLRIIVGETGVVSKMMGVELPKWHRYLYQYLYPFADLIICPSIGARDDLKQFLNIGDVKLLTIYNPIDVDGILASASQADNPFKDTGPGPHIVAAGRLHPVKRFDFLLDSLARFQARQEKGQLWILGSGTLLNELESRCRLLSISPSVHFMGFQENVFVWFKHADLVVVCSMYESLCNTLLEALVCGSRVLAVDSPGGIREVMSLTGNTGSLVPRDKFTIEEGLMGKPPRVGTVDTIREYFGVEKIVNAYEKVLGG